MEEYAIEFIHVSKIFKLKGVDKKSQNKMFYALKDLNFKIPKGEVTGILGTNGSGKSTMATLLAEIASPDEGEIIVNGEQALIAINLGLNGQLSGLENIKLKGALLGLKPHKIQEIINGVMEFSELGEFIYQPVKKYSSGMKARLGFSINLCLDPDILIVDEALSVGDKGFANKCMGRMNELKEEGKTIVFISHSLPQVEEFCQTAIWIEGGYLREYGGTTEICTHYSEYVDWLNSLKGEEKNKENERKFNERILTDHKENGWDKVLSMIQKNPR